MYAEIIDGFDVESLQSALHTLTQWAEKWQLLIPIDKSFVLYIGKVCVDTCFYINSNFLPNAKQCRDLNVTISHNLQSSEHINIIVAKAHQRANAILRCLYLITQTYLLVPLVYVSPLVQYHSVTWSPYLKQDIKAIQRVQRCFTKRFLPGFNKYSYCERLAQINLPRLEIGIVPTAK